jgi:hypothetical protein
MDRATSSRRFLPALVATLAFAAATAVAPARAEDPGRWLLTGATSVPNTYWQGLTSDPAGSRIYFVGIFEGLWRTDPALAPTAGVPSAIPPAVKAAEGYNHIGDPSWDSREGGRVVLPLECFTPGVGNTCGTGSFGIADPATLGFRYYVRLDPAEIPKAMWAETSPDGELIWTSSGNDLLAYRSRAVSAANSAPSGRLLRAVERRPATVPPTGVTGAVFERDRLLLAGESNGTYQVWGVDPRNGARRLELEMEICGESEGLDAIDTLGGELHWLIAPFDPGCSLTFGPSSALLHFIPAPAHERFEVEVLSVDLDSLPGDATVRVRAARDGKPLRRARVGFAGVEGRTDKAGVATLVVPLELPGRYKAIAWRGQSFGASDLVRVGLPAGALRFPAPTSGAR